MISGQTLLLVFVGFVLHLTLMASIFDMYFRSPIVHGMTPHAVSGPPPARRLVLFVGDGVRADSFFELDVHGETRTPYLRQIMQTRGSWGVSHTHVPTESRPGHVALIAGFYEDVSAVTRGWKENPVEFDSLFNQSRQTWSWGSPDILPMFSKGARANRVLTYTYPAEVEDFGAQDASSLDRWVFDRVGKFLDEAESNQKLSEQLNQDAVVLFLHLLGSDTNGHAHRPTSRQYVENIQIVDEGVRNISLRVEELFGNDGRTAFIFTADHGMTDWGAHGSGLAHETLTPLVAWGAGISGPRHLEQSQKDERTRRWKLDNLQRNDVEQADVAPLMASLLGVPLPLNSVGRLPLSYLNTSDRHKALCILTNARQILEQFEVTANLKRASLPDFLFVPFGKLPPSYQLNELHHIEKHVRDGNYNEAITMSSQLISTGLEGLRYYQTYDRFFIGTCVVLGMVGLMLCILTEVFAASVGAVRHTRSVSLHVTIPLCTLATSLSFLLYMQNVPLQYYIYGLLPLACTWHLASRWMVVKNSLVTLAKSQSWTTTLIYCLATVVGVELLVWSFFHRWLLSVGLLALSAWPIVARQQRSRVTISWTFSCIVLSVFPLLPVVGHEPCRLLVNSAALLACILVPTIFHQLQSITKTSWYSREGVLTAVQYSLLLIAVYVVNSTASTLVTGQSLHVQHIISWSLLVIAPLLPMLGSSVITLRLHRLAIATFIVYILMSTSYEALFLLVLSGTLYSWLVMESSRLNKGNNEAMAKQMFTVQVSQHLAETTSSRQRPIHSDARARVVEITDGHQETAVSVPDTLVQLSWNDVRAAFFYVFFSLVAFFGTGNIASLNTFNISSVYTFITVFSPFTMAMLLFVKILLPLFLVGCAFNAVRTVCCVPARELFALSLVMSDFLALHFFFFVRDSGSWLDIGTSISHYVMGMTLTLALLVIFGLAHLSTTSHFGGGLKAHDE